MDGDANRPIITVRFYMGDKLAPFDFKGVGENAKNKKRQGNATKSKETDRCNELTMDDTVGEERLRMRARKTWSLRCSAIHVPESLATSSRSSSERMREKKCGDQRELIYQDKDSKVRRNQIEHTEGNRQVMISSGDADGGKLETVIEKQEIKKVGDVGVDGPETTLIGCNEGVNFYGR